EPWHLLPHATPKPRIRGDQPGEPHRATVCDRSRRARWLAFSFARYAVRLRVASQKMFYFFFTGFFFAAFAGFFAAGFFAAGFFAIGFFLRFLVAFLCSPRAASRAAASRRAASSTNNLSNTASPRSGARSLSSWIC